MGIHVVLSGIYCSTHNTWNVNSNSNVVEIIQIVKFDYKYNHNFTTNVTNY